MSEPVVIRDHRGREAVKFTTPSGVVAWVDRWIPPAVTDRFIRKLRRKCARRLAAAGRRTSNQDRA